MTDEFTLRWDSDEQALVGEDPETENRIIIPLGEIQTAWVELHDYESADNLPDDAAPNSIAAANGNLYIKGDE